MERGALQPIFDVLRHGLVGYDAEIHKRTLERGLLSLIGAGAAELAGAATLPADEHAHARAERRRRSARERCARTSAST